MYEFTPEMIEISGFGGSYEQACRNMLKAALDWMDTHPDSNPRFRVVVGVPGLIFDENKDALLLEQVIEAASGGDCTGVMSQIIMCSSIWIAQNGWDKYVAAMRKTKTEPESDDEDSW